MRQTLVLVSNNALREKFNFDFSTAFCLYLQNQFWGEDWVLGYNSIKIENLLNIF